MLQGINNTMVRSPKINFGSADAAPPSLGAINPAPISNNPYEERHGYIKDDIYGLKSNNSDMALMAHPKMDMFPGLTDVHDGQQSKTPASILKPLITVGVVVGGTVLAIKKRKNIGNFFKNIFKKGSKATTPKEVKNISEFNAFYKDMESKIQNDKFSDIAIPNKTKVILQGKTADERKELLAKAYEVASASAKNNVQPKIKVLMPEELSTRANNIVNHIKIGKVDALHDTDIAKIDGFEIVKTGYSHPEIAIEEKVMHSTNIYSVSDRWNAACRRVKEFFGHP